MRPQLVGGLDGRWCYAAGREGNQAHVRNGQIVPDEPTELPEGASVEVFIEVANDFAMTPEELGRART